MMYTAPAGVGAPAPEQASFGAATLASPALPSPAALGPDPPGQQNQPGFHQPGFQSTMLGVARPGIAPLEPGRVKDSDRPPAPAVMPPAPRQPIAAAAKSPAAAPGPVSPRVAPPRGIPRGALVLVVVAVLLGAMAGIVALLWDAPRPLTAEVILDERGREALSITCGDCPDGTLVTTAGGKATLKEMKAVLSLTRPLEVGSNVVAVGVQRPGLGRDEDVRLQVPVDFRVRGDLSPLSEDPPRLKVLVQAAPGGAAVVEGKPVTLDPAGKGEHAVEVGRELEGPADGVVPFERKLSFSITPPGGTPRTGEVTLRFGIVPLRVDAPGDAIVMEGETFMLSGRTLSEGRITVSGRPITVDAAGRFAQLMNVSSEGETTVVVRAEAKDQAPRLVRVRVKRVTSLEEHAATFRQNAVSDYAALVGTASPGQAVALEGEVVEARVDGEVTVLLLEAKEGCASSPCLVKVVYGSKLEAARGSTLSAFGRLRGMVDGPRTGVRIPELTAEFVVPVRPRARPRR